MNTSPQEPTRGTMQLRVDNSTYKPIIEELLELLKLDENDDLTRP